MRHLKRIWILACLVALAVGVAVSVGFASKGFEVGKAHATPVAGAWLGERDGSWI